MISLTTFSDLLRLVGKVESNKIIVTQDLISFEDTLHIVHFYPNKDGRVVVEGDLAAIDAFSRLLFEGS